MLVGSIEISEFTTLEEARWLIAKELDRVSLGKSASGAEDEFTIPTRVTLNSSADASPEKAPVSGVQRSTRKIGPRHPEHNESEMM